MMKGYLYYYCLENCTSVQKFIQSKRKKVIVADDYFLKQFCIFYIDYDNDAD